MVHLFWDIGGVLLTNGWDRHARAAAAHQFGFDLAEFARRHDRVVDDFDCGRMGMEEYLTETLFYRPRDFTRDSLRDFMYAQSRPFSDVMRIAESVAGDPNCFMLALNNESLPLNEYRIKQFDLRRYFRCFFSSCFLGVRKPEPRIYELALQLTQSAPESCVFIDDRSDNLEPAKRFNIRTIHFKSAAQLQRDLAALGVGR